MTNKETNLPPRLKGAIIGFGFIAARGHFPAYVERMKTEQDIEIVAICDICPSRAKDLPPEIRFYEDYQELLDKEGDSLDFVDIATHAGSHAEIVLAALERGCHVLCEKPLTTSVKDAETIILKARECGKILFPCHNYKHAPVVKTIRSVIASGQIGKITSATISTFRNTHALGQEDWLPDWRRTRELSGGGIGMDHGFHSLYLLFEWLGNYPLSVTASGFNMTGGDYDTEDNFSATFEFPDGLANIYLTWTAGVRKVIYTLQGEKGAITIDDDQMELALLQREDNSSNNHKASWKVERSIIESDWMDSSHVKWFNSKFDKFKTAIYDNDIMNQNIQDAYYCINSIMAAYQSMKNSSKRVIMENNFYPPRED